MIINRILFSAFGYKCLLNRKYKSYYIRNVLSFLLSPWNSSGVLTFTILLVTIGVVIIYNIFFRSNISFFSFPLSLTRLSVFNIFNYGEIGIGYDIFTRGYLLLGIGLCVTSIIILSTKPRTYCRNIVLMRRIVVLSLWREESIYRLCELTLA